MRPVEFGTDDGVGSCGRHPDRRPLDAPKAAQLETTAEVADAQQPPVSVGLDDRSLDDLDGNSFSAAGQEVGEGCLSGLACDRASAGPDEENVGNRTSHERGRVAADQDREACIDLSEDIAVADRDPLDDRFGDGAHASHLTLRLLEPLRRHGTDEADRQHDSCRRDDADREFAAIHQCKEVLNRRIMMDGCGGHAGEVQEADRESQEAR